MARPASVHPTDLELEILKVLWQNGPMTVRDAREALAKNGRDLAYTSIMTMMSIMAGKGQVKRTIRQGGSIYSAKLAQAPTQARMLKDTVTRVFNGSAHATMLHLLNTSDLTQDELRDIQQLLAEKAKKK